LNGCCSFYDVMVNDRLAAPGRQSAPRDQLNSHHRLALLVRHVIRALSDL
jgi:hypothetical protein